MIREPRRTDQGYITNSWLKSITRGTHAWERHGTARTGRQINRLIDDVLDRKDTRALVCAKPNDPDFILGWVVYCSAPSVPMVHYMFVRADYREKKIAGELLHRVGVRRDGGVVCTSDGPSSTMMRRLYPAAVHMPLAEFLKPNR